MHTLIMLKPEGIPLLRHIQKNGKLNRNENRDNYLDDIFIAALNKAFADARIEVPFLIESGFINISPTVYQIIYGDTPYIEPELCEQLKMRMESNQCYAFIFNFPENLDLNFIKEWKGKVWKEENHLGTGIRRYIKEILGTKPCEEYDLEKDFTLNFIHTSDTEKEVFELLNQLKQEGQIFEKYRKEEAFYLEEHSTYI